MYTEEENENGELPEGFEVGDLKPHLIEYIPVGSYILREERRLMDFTVCGYPICNRRYQRDPEKGDAG